MRQVVWGSSGTINLKEVECGYQTAVIMLVGIQDTHSTVSDDSGLRVCYAMSFGVIGCRRFKRVASKRREQQNIEHKVPQDTNSHYATYLLKYFT
jgi:hypothetical protein